MLFHFGGQSITGLPAIDTVFWGSIEVFTKILYCPIKIIKVNSDSTSEYKLNSFQKVPISIYMRPLSYFHIYGQYNACK